MADVTITAANVLPGSGCKQVDGLAGETITAGKAVYLAAATQKYMLADNDSATAEAHDAVGVALNGASLNQPVKVATRGPVTIGGTVVAGTTYCVSSTAGGICPQADVATGDEVVVLGQAISTTVLNLDVHATGVNL